MTNEDKRLANTEYAMVALWNMIGPTLNTELLFAVDQMIGDYFDANKSLGADFNKVHMEFYKDDTDANE